MAQSPKSPFFSVEELNNLKSAYETGGLEAFVPLIQRKLNELDSTRLNIAVTGESGAGKSTFVNAMRGLRSDDKGAAKSGVVQTTMKATPYPHPSLPNVCFWDQPGIGTKQFPANEYLSELKKYDFFFIISACRFTENDAKLAEEIKLLGKNFYFTRSKIDNDLDSFVKQGINFNKQEVVDKIRNDCVGNLKQERFPSPTVFLISSFKLNEFDFPALNKTLANNLDDIKKHVFLLSLPNTASDIIENKRKELKKRIWVLVTLSGAMGAVPIPGLSFLYDVGTLVTAIIDFRQYLGLDDASLQRLANTVGKPVGDLKAVVKTPLVGEINKEFVTRMFQGSVAGGISAVEIVLDFIPVVGSIFGAGSSFLMIYKLLNVVLKELVENAQRVVKAAFGTD